MGALRITRVEAATAAAWDRAWQGSAAATWFQSRAWAETWAAFTRGRLRPEPKRVVFSDGATAWVPLCAQRGRLGGVTGHASSPGGTSGGWIASEEVGKAHAALLTAWLLERPGLVWRVNPFDPLALDGVGALGEADATWLLPLAGGFDAVHRGFSKGHRAAARRAEREGVSVDRATGDADWEAYYLAYRESVARWGERARTVYPASFFASLREHAGDAARLWVARHAGEVVAGALLFEAPAHTVYWHGAVRTAALRLNAVSLLLRTLIENACADGIDVFDFNPSGDNPGVSAFKKSFGAEPRPCPVIRTPGRGLRARARRWLTSRRAP